MSINATKLQPKPAADSEADAAGASEPDFEALLVAVANYRDQAAFEQLFNSFARRIYGLGMKISRSEHISRELVQEVMLTIWQNAAAYDLDKGSAKSWIFALSRNKCIDMIRRASRQPQELSAAEVWPDDLCDLATQPETAGADGNVAALDATRIRQLSESLPEPQRQAVEMIYIHDRTHEEAALELNIPLGTLKSRLRLGMNKLRALLQTTS